MNITGLFTSGREGYFTNIEFRSEQKGKNKTAMFVGGTETYPTPNGKN